MVGTNLEGFQSILASLEHLADGRLLLSLGEIVHRLEHLDGSRKSRSPDGAYQMPSKPNAGFEKVRVSLDLLWPTS